MKAGVRNRQPAQAVSVQLDAASDMKCAGNLFGFPARM
jgi:hypothetical protein